MKSSKLKKEWNKGDIKCQFANDAVNVVII